MTENLTLDLPGNPIKKSQQSCDQTPLIVEGLLLFKKVMNYLFKGKGVPVLLTGGFS